MILFMEKQHRARPVFVAARPVAVREIIPELLTTAYESLKQSTSQSMHQAS